MNRSDRDVSGQATTVEQNEVRPPSPDPTTEMENYARILLAELNKRNAEILELKKFIEGINLTRCI
jgi:hypothetical protein